MIYSFSKKTVLITGSSRGIGKSLVESFLASGSTVIGVSKSSIKIEGDYTHYSTDLSNVNESIKQIKKILKINKIDILINNAGIYPQDKLFDSSIETWDNVFNVNLKSLFFISKLIASQMKINKGGVIVNAASYAGTHPSIGSGLYAATKSSVISLTKSMAAEWSKYNIRVNSYSPGFILTDMTEPLYKKFGDSMTSKLAIDRPGKPSEVADIILYLCSDKASYITGIDMKIDGGKFIVQNQEKA